jgi:hypothetical protein
VLAAPVVAGAQAEALLTRSTARNCTMYLPAVRIVMLELVTVPLQLVPAFVE